MMDEEKVRILLDHLSQEVPEDMDLWDDIRVKAQTALKPTPRLVFNGARAAAAVVLLFALVGTAYAVYQAIMFRGSDAGIRQVEELLTPLNLVESLADADVNVRLDWAYADGHRIAIAYTVDHAASLEVPTYVEGTLNDADGSAYPYAAFLRGGGSGGGGDQERAQFGSTLSFDAASISGSPESLDLRLALRFVYSSPQSNTGPGGGGGGGGGGAAGTAKTRAVEPFEVTFDFSVPFIPASRINGTLTQTADDITMTLSDVSYAPSVTLARACFTAPPDDRFWMPAVVAQDGEKLYNIGGFVADEADAPAGEICGLLSLFEPAVEGKTLTIAIPHLFTDQPFTDERFAQFEAALKERGFEIELTPPEGDRQGYSLNILGVPEDLLGMDAYPVVQGIQALTLWDRQGGPWKFEVMLP